MRSDDLSSDFGVRRAVLAVALLNLTYFGIEFAVALRIGSVSLFADSVDFLEDTSVNLLILLALRWSLKARSRVGMALALVLLVPTLAIVWSIWNKFLVPIPPAPIPLTVTGSGALVVNLICALLLTRYRHHRGSLTRAAFLSARNDAFANIAIVLAGGLTAATSSRWPDLIVGISIMAMNADAAREVWQAAHQERRATRQASES